MVLLQVCHKIFEFIIRNWNFAADGGAAYFFQQPGLPFLRKGQVQFLQLVPEQTATRVAAEFHGSGSVADFPGGERFVGFAVRQQAAAMNAGFVPEHRFAHHRLIRLNGPAGGARDPLNCRVSTPQSLFKVRRAAMTTSSSAALPARSPKPLTVTLAQSAPQARAAMVLAVAMPRSLCP
jgi:hypothetical protein